VAGDYLEDDDDERRRARIGNLLPPSAEIARPG
jgi:hypothetical protein